MVIFVISILNRQTGYFPGNGQEKSPKKDVEKVKENINLLFAFESWRNRNRSFPTFFFQSTIAIQIVTKKNPAFQSPAK